jgi:hypothetical protein
LDDETKAVTLQISDSAPYDAANVKTGDCYSVAGHPSRSDKERLEGPTILSAFLLSGEITVLTLEIWKMENCRQTIIS